MPANQATRWMAPASPVFAAVRRLDMPAPTGIAHAFKYSIMAIAAFNFGALAMQRPSA